MIICFPKMRANDNLIFDDSNGVSGASTSAEHEVECVSSADLRRKNRFRDRLAQSKKKGLLDLIIFLYILLGM